MNRSPNAQLDQERLVARIETLQFTLDRMGEEIERLSDMASLRELSAMIAHEVRNLMTPVAAYPGSALNRPTDEQLTRDALTQAAKSPTVAAIMIEPVQGEGGIRPVPDQCLKGLRDLADEHGSRLIFDEGK